jgi:cation diffusion facilitator CzcD-associated flavoprotein CzcO
MTASPKVAIIGAGISGLTSSKPRSTDGLW